MNYVVVFDAGNRNYSLFWLTLMGLPFIASAVLIVISRARPKSASTSWSLLILPLVAIMLVLISGMVFGFGRYRLLAALKTGRCDVTEGIVTDFTPVEPDGRGDESFSVASRRFHYSDYEIRPGF